MDVLQLLRNQLRMRSSSRVPLTTPGANASNDTSELPKRKQIPADDNDRSSASNVSNAGGSIKASGKGSYFEDYIKRTQSNGHYFDPISFDLWAYLRVEMFGIGEPGSLEPPSKEHIQNFFLVPFNLESLIFLGFFISLDAFLYVITYLPIRVMFSLYLLIGRIQAVTLEFVTAPFLGSPKSSTTESADDMSKKPPLGFHRTHMYDLMRGAMFIVGCIVLRQINMSEVYHLIRGQSMIKLYVLTSMLEIFDKLLSSFGQDAFDALHWNTRYQPRSLKMVLTFLMVTGYVCIHSTIYFLHVATMTVVINSVDKALITVLILNNFAEMKVFILKKFDCNNLFQLACSDITERFQMFLFLFLILLVALGQAGDSWLETIQLFARIGFMMLVGECVADWMKHAFINKFNFINASVYQDFAYVLRGDILTNQKDEIILDHTYSVTRRLGLSQIPLGCVCIRYLMLAIATPSVQMYLLQISSQTLWVQSIGLFAGLVLLKVIIGVALVFYSSGAHRRDAAIFMRSPAAVRPPKMGPAHVPTATSHQGSNAGTATPLPREAAPLPITPLNIAESVAIHSLNSNNFLHQFSGSHGHLVERNRGNSITNHFSDLNETISAAGSPLPKGNGGRTSPSFSPGREEAHGIDPAYFTFNDVGASTTTTGSVGNADDAVDRIRNGDSQPQLPVGRKRGTSNASMSRSGSDTNTANTILSSSMCNSSSAGIALPSSSLPATINSIASGERVSNRIEATAYDNPVTSKHQQSSMSVEIPSENNRSSQADLADGFLKAHIAMTDPGLKERLDLLEELSSMERYTVYKGRII